MDSLTQLLIGDLEVAAEIVVTARMILIMFALEIFSCVVNFLGGIGRR